ncbi:transketolase [Massiliimalia massiliensis]|jgi:transketolase|uniref:transketolase n=1 Tax=Massiliimalia massiliensis TaxID=1852384 RepID=UPI0009862C2D|nr:transketolase [Massiliimalia massiliensis]
MENLKAKSFSLRKDILDIIFRAKAGHIGGDFSVCDILNVLYNKHMNVTPENFDSPEHDRFILSKGHSVEALYSVLADKGFIPKEDLKTVSQFQSKYIGHPNTKVNGIEMCSGSLGHGLSVAAGMAIAGKMDQAGYRVYVVMGDGELAEGSVWEGAMCAGHYKLDNLIAVVDRNRLQISGCTEDVMAQDSQDDRWASFGWNVLHAAGNDVDALDEAFTKAKAFKGKPTVIIADTTKGCGVSFMENQAGWHHRVPTAEEYEKAVAELEERRVAACE